jgi:hypothetical protein
MRDLPCLPRIHGPFASFFFRFELSVWLSLLQVSCFDLSATVFTRCVLGFSSFKYLRKLNLNSLVTLIIVHR